MTPPAPTNDLTTPPLLPLELEVLDDRFADVHGDRHVQRLFDGGRWLEGPVHVPAWRCVLFSDIPGDRVLRLDETTGRVDLWQQPAGFHNGHSLDRAGRVLSCEHGTRSVTRTEHDDSRTVLAERFEGGRLNSPNDVVEASDGSVWFTDPSYGIDDGYEGHPAEREVDGCHLYRISPDGTLDAVARDFDRPNGLAFSADESVLYVTDTGRGHVRALDVADGSVRDRGVLAECTSGGFDGVRLDAVGRLWLAAGDGLHCLAPDGTLLGRLLLPETTSNLTFGGLRGNVLYVTATTSLYAVMLNVTGVRRP